MPALWQIGIVSHDSRQLEVLFADCFLERFKTRLEGGGAEPLYLPSADPDDVPHRVVYRQDYFASGLHEVAHWCMAGPERRRLEDYGYWYSPDGRDERQQAAFERVEAKPQAIEWIFSDACGFDFQLSADNLAAGCGPSAHFEEAVNRQRELYLEKGLPLRARLFCEALAKGFVSSVPAPRALAFPSHPDAHSRKSGG